MAVMLTLADGSHASDEDIEHFVLCKPHLDRTECQGSVPWFKGLDLPPVRDNDALALFHLERNGGHQTGRVSSAVAETVTLV